MLTDRGRRISICNGALEYSNRKKFRGFGNNNGYGFVNRSEGCRDWNPSRSSSTRILRISSPTSSPPSSTSPVSLHCSTGVGYIEHRVSKLNTLAGIAIKYGVEVADITKLNGLVTDLQMFALKSLRIPLPGRHPPSPCLSNGSLNHGEEDCSERASSPAASNGNHQDVFDTFPSLKLSTSEKKVSPAMNSLQGYYGLKPKNKRDSEGFEMAVYKKESSCLQDNGQYLAPFPVISTPLNHHRKSRSLVDAVIAEVNQSSNHSKAGGEVNSYDKPTRRCQKSEADFTSRTPELLLKEDNRSRTGGFSAIAGKGLALRPKAASRTNLSADTDTNTGNSNPVPINLMDTPAGDSFSSVRKSFSASSLQEPDNGSSLWPTSKWTLTPDLLTQAAMASSIFDGLPKPLLTGRRNKKAVD